MAKTIENPYPSPLNSIKSAIQSPPLPPLPACCSPPTWPCRSGERMISHVDIQRIYHGYVRLVNFFLDRISNGYKLFMVLLMINTKDFPLDHYSNTNGNTMDNMVSCRITWRYKPMESNGGVPSMGVSLKNAGFSVYSRENPKRTAGWLRWGYPYDLGNPKKVAWKKNMIGNPTMVI